MALFTPSFFIVLRPLLASERLTPGPDGLARIELEEPFRDGTYADPDPP